MPTQSWQIFRQAKKKLAKGVLHKIFGKSTRLLDMWAANPAHCEVTARNPLDRVRLRIDELDNAGCEDYARAAIDFLAEPLGGQFAPFGTERTDRGSVDGELVDFYEVSGKFVINLRQALADGHLSSAERILIKDTARNIIKELRRRRREKMRKVPVKDKISIQAKALRRKHFRQLRKQGFSVSTMTFQTLLPEQMDDFIDALVNIFAPDKADEIIEALDNLSRDDYLRVSRELIAETWGDKEEEKN
jgi:hypothetical protein